MASPYKSFWISLAEELPELGREIVITNGRIVNHVRYDDEDERDLCRALQYVKHTLYFFYSGEGR